MEGYIIQIFYTCKINFVIFYIHFQPWKNVLQAVIQKLFVCDKCSARSRQDRNFNFWPVSVFGAAPTFWTICLTILQFIGASVFYFLLFFQ